MWFEPRQLNIHRDVRTLRANATKFDGFYKARTSNILRRGSAIQARPDPARARG